MAKLARICTTCFSVIPAGQSCPGCGAGSQAARVAAQPWRAVYQLPSYRKNRALRYRQTGGRCECCGIELKGAPHPDGVPWECDHFREARLFLADLDEANDIENLRCFCVKCHRAKTAKG